MAESERRIQILGVYLLRMPGAIDHDPSAPMQMHRAKAPTDEYADRLLTADNWKMRYAGVKAITLGQMGTLQPPADICVYWVRGDQRIRFDQTLREQGLREDDVVVVLAEPDTEESADFARFIARLHKDEVARKQVDDIADQIAKKLKETPTRPASSSQFKEQVFVAMPMDDERLPELADTLDTIKQVCSELDLRAVRVDDIQTTSQITDTIRETIHESRFVIADLTHSRPNVFYEAGFADAIGKTPVYIAADGTKLEFDVQGYPVVFFKNQRELREKLSKRMNGLASGSATVPKT